MVLLAITGAVALAATLPLLGGAGVAPAARDAPTEPWIPEVARLGAVVGVVRDWNGAPLPAVLVRIPAYDLGATTDAAGRYRFYTVPEGRILVRAEADGYVSEARTVDVREGVVHEINLRLATDEVPAPRIAIYKLDGRLSCKALALGLGVACEGTNDHRVNFTLTAKEAVLELVWDEGAAPRLNLTAGPLGATDPVTRRPARSWAGGEGEPTLRLVVAPATNEGAFAARVRYASDATGLPAPVDYSVYATVFLDRPAPADYSIFRRP